VAVVTRAKSAGCAFNHPGILELDHKKYREALRHDRTLLVVEVEHAKSTRIERLIGRFAPIDIDALHCVAMHAEIRDFSPATEYHWH
jgi:hypothetical protein